MKDTPSHYFSAQPTTPSRRREIALTLPDISATLVTDSAVFSPERLDRGTQLLLLEAAQPGPDVRTVVDVGCGYGPIALTIAQRCPNAQVWAIDTNQRALDLCRENADRLGLANVTVAAPEDVPGEVMFDYLASNPPIRIGKSALHELLARWLGRVVPGGHGELVVQRHLGSDSLQKWLQTTQGWPTERRCSRQGFRVLRVTIPSDHRYGEEE